MTEPLQSGIDVGSGEQARRISVIRREGAAPGLFWLGGFRSDMAGTKAETLDRFAEAEGLAATRFDYSGHGASGGDFLDGTISRWLDEAEAVLDRFTSEPQILVGSSMGGWIALLLARRLRESGRGDRLAGLILIAPAVDMTKDLMEDRFDEAARAELASSGRYAEPSDYSDEPAIITAQLIEDGRQHLFGDRPIETGCPVHVIQGMQDPDVPWGHATALMEKLAFDDAVMTLVRDGDHRLSRPEDLERLRQAATEMVASFRDG